LHTLEHLAAFADPADEVLAPLTHAGPDRTFGLDLVRAAEAQ
jgi:hypothetical protein